MFDNSRFYELIVLIYACSLFFYFIDYLQPNRKVNRLAFWLLAIVWVMQSFYFISQAIDHRALPLFSQFDILFFYAWLLISLSLMINWFFRMEFFPFFTNLIGFCVITFSVFLAAKEIPDAMSGQVSSEWLIIHISMALLSYAAFTLSFIFSGLYLVQHQILKRKKWSKQFRRWPSLAQLDVYSFHFNLIGFPLFLLSLILGIVWAYHTLEILFWYDTKVLFSLFVLLLYGNYLYQRVVKGWSGKKNGELNLICFMVLLVNYFISDIFSIFHFWE